MRRLSAEHRVRKSDAVKVVVGSSSSGGGWPECSRQLAEARQVIASQRDLIEQLEADLANLTAPPVADRTPPDVDANSLPPVQASIDDPSKWG